MWVVGYCKWQDSRSPATGSTALCDQCIVLQPNPAHEIIFLHEAEERAGGFGSIDTYRQYPFHGVDTHTRRAATVNYGNGDLVKFGFGSKTVKGLAAG